ncbi:DUF1638 domain-containing protein [Desulfosporosinus sp. SB140]|uniref:DUF1638 domain-containing protein n=1 Tax=Desulfosporosinus paludis TaxID=3115649 RepID=UPI00388D4BF9
MSIAPEKTLVIACDVLKNQLESLGPNPYTFVYLEQGLHRTPGKLKEELQKVIDSSSENDLILLGYGLCSRAVIGLRAQAHQMMIIPRIDDCIGLSMGTRDMYYDEFNQNPGSYYFTKGWVEAAEDPLKEYRRIAAKHGVEIAEWTSRECMKHYRRAVFIKTQAEAHEPSRLYVKEFAQFFNLDYEEMLGSPIYLKKLLFGPWDEDFVIIPAGQAVDDAMFTI